MAKGGGLLSITAASQEVLLRIGILALICILGAFGRLGVHPSRLCLGLPRR